MSRTFGQSNLCPSAGDEVNGGSGAIRSDLRHALAIRGDTPLMGCDGSNLGPGQSVLATSPAVAAGRVNAREDLSQICRWRTWSQIARVSAAHGNARHPVRRTCCRCLRAASWLRALRRIVTGRRCDASTVSNRCAVRWFPSAHRGADESVVSDVASNDSVTAMTNRQIAALALPHFACVISRGPVVSV